MQDMDVRRQAREQARICPLRKGSDALISDMDLAIMQMTSASPLRLHAPPPFSPTATASTVTHMHRA